jgi:NADH dehydrogenase
LLAVRSLKRARVKITLIDRRNLSYVSTVCFISCNCGIIAGRNRCTHSLILRGQRNVEVLLGDVQDFDLARKVVKLPDLVIPYDYLIVATGASHAYFGHDDWEPFAPGLKTIEDAIEIRRRVFLAFELAERQVQQGEAQTPLNFVVVGGGPTGVELAGTLTEIARRVLADEFHAIDPKRARIVLYEGGPRVLATLSGRSFQKRGGTTAQPGRGGSHLIGRHQG